MNPRYEYVSARSVHPDNLDNVLNEHASRGWRLHSLEYSAPRHDFRAIFERETDSYV